MGLFGHFLPFHECFKLLPFNVSALLYEVIPSPCDCEPFGVETFFLLIQLLFGLGWLLLPFCVGGFRLKVRLRRYCDWLWLGVHGWSFSDFLFCLSERPNH